MNWRATVPSSDTAAVRGFVPPQNDEERMCMRHAEDLARIACQRGIPRYSAFLSDREQLLAEAAMHKANCTCCRFEGGWPGAERRVLCIEPEGCAPCVPIGCIEITCRLVAGATAPQHKDYLGSLMGLELKREAMGDILLPDPEQEGRAYLFVLKNAANVVLSELCRVGSVGVETREIELSELPAFPQAQHTIQTATVSSLRLDAVLAAMLHCSRGQAAELITAGRVEINHVPAASAHASVYCGDLFTVRGKGRFELTELPGKSRKDRTIISYFQY
jgi:RNA-binding protein YlmH